jgi:tRNA (guanine-N7-)-methyltransferase
MGRNKLKKFKEIKKFKNVLERSTPDNRDIVEEFIKNRDATLEIGCGRGEYTVGLAKKYPEKVFIGLDIQGERIWHGAKYALEQNLNNVLFVRTYAYYLPELFPVNSIDEIWLTFPDPFPKDRHEKKRLTSSKYLAILKKVLKEDGILNLKTDSNSLYLFSLSSIKNAGGKILKNTNNLYSEEPEDNDLTIQTYFEKKYLNSEKDKNQKKIKYIKATFP